MNQRKWYMVVAQTGVITPTEIASFDDHMVYFTENKLDFARRVAENYGYFPTAEEALVWLSSRIKRNCDYIYKELSKEYARLSIAQNALVECLKGKDGE